MKHAALIAVVAALAGTAPPAIGQEAGAREAGAPSQIEEVQQLANRWTTAYNSGDRAALGALYTDTAQLYMHGSPTLSGRRGIEAFWAEDMKVDNPLTVLRVTNAVNGRDMRLVHGDYQVLNRKTGEPLGGGRFAHIWTRTDGQWRLDRDLWNQPYER